MPEFVTTQKRYEEFLNKALKYDAVALDTEFIREKTYWPKLCLIQLATKDEAILVDPFLVDILPIKRLLTNKDVVKVFHAPRQDIEILHHKTGVFPKPMFDTQIAASFLGHATQVGYGHLVHSELGVKLHKGDSYTVWSDRPLSKSQLNYAEDDVTYLIKLYYSMTKKLKRLGRDKWAQQDINKYLNPELYNVDPYERFWHLRKVNQLKKAQLSAARELSAWREITSMKRNLPRRWILSDEQIVEACRMKISCVSDLLRLRGIKGKLSMDDIRDIVDALTKGFNAKPKDWPDVREFNAIHGKNICHTQDCPLHAQIDLMKAIVDVRADENDIAAQTICTSKDLSFLAQDATDDLELLEGWRYKIVGKDLLDFINGKLLLGFKNGKVAILRIDEV